MLKLIGFRLIKLIVQNKKMIFIDLKNKKLKNMSEICEFCNNEFINIISLKSHQRKSKYCLKIQEKEFKCDDCNKIFYISKDLDNHRNTCTDVLKNRIKELEKENANITYLKHENDKLKQKTIDIEQDKIYLQIEIKKLEKENGNIKFLKYENDKLKQQIIDNGEDKISLQEHNNYLHDEILNITKSTTISHRAICFEKDCKKTPRYNMKGGIALYCSNHKYEEMIDVIRKNRTCYHEGCNTRPIFNIEGNTQGLYCALHKKEDMVDVKHKKCKTYMCPTIVKDKYDGYCLFCYMNLFPDKPVSYNYKTKEYAVVEFVKQKYPDLSWITDKKVEDGCSRRRPDLLLDLGYQIIIVEIDENQHISYDCTCENKRLMELSQDLQHRPIIFIRFNPDEYKKNDELISSCWGNNKKGICVIQKKEEWKNRLESLNEQINYWLNPENKTDKTIEIVELFYDITESDEDKQIKSEVLEHERPNIEKKSPILKSTNNKILNMSELNFNNDNEVKNIIEDNYNIDVIKEGQKGVARFITKFLLTGQDGKLKYICTDASRKVFKFKNDTGQIEKDINATKLLKILSENGLIEKTSDISQQFWTKKDGSIDNDKFYSMIDKTIEIKNININNTIFKNELVNITS